MKKNRAVITMILAVLAIIGFGYIAFVGIGAGKTGSMGNIKQGLDLAGGVSITYQVVGDESPSAEDMSDTIYKLQKRVENYSTEAQVYQEGNDRINIEIPGVSDANAILEELAVRVLFTLSSRLTVTETRIIRSVLQRMVHMIMYC